MQQLECLEGLRLIFILLKKNVYISYYSKVCKNYVNEIRNFYNFLTNLKINIIIKFSLNILLVLNLKYEMPIVKINYPFSIL